MISRDVLLAAEGIYKGERASERAGRRTGEVPRILCISHREEMLMIRTLWDGGRQCTRYFPDHFYGMCPPAVFAYSPWLTVRSDGNLDPTSPRRSRGVLRKPT